MTAEASLTDERLAELIAYCESFNPVTHPQIVEQLSALRELQAYRAKRETHVWVPKEPTYAMRIAGRQEFAIYVSQIEWAMDDGLKNDYCTAAPAEIYRAMVSAAETVLAASDGNPP